MTLNRVDGGLELMHQRPRRTSLLDFSEQLQNLGQLRFAWIGAGQQPQGLAAQDVNAVVPFDSTDGGESFGRLIVFSLRDRNSKQAELVGQIVRNVLGQLQPETLCGLVVSKFVVNASEGVA